jgi:hypothetical protein
MTATQALKKLSEVSGESALIVADPKDGIAVVVRWEDPERRLAFCVDSHFENEADDHLYLVARGRRVPLQRGSEAEGTRAGRPSANPFFFDRK